MEIFLDLFGAQNAAWLLGDREFVGRGWFYPPKSIFRRGLNILRSLVTNGVGARSSFVIICVLAMVSSFSIKSCWLRKVSALIRRMEFLLDMNKSSEVEPTRIAPQKVKALVTKVESLKG